MENKKKWERLSGKEGRLWKTKQVKKAAAGSENAADSFWLRLVRGIPAKKREDLLWALLLTAALFVPAAVKFDFYYDLNDDVLIKDILSGVYSGTPDGHTMQLLYPLGLVLSLLYRGLSIPAFGVFLVLCQYGSIFLIAYRTVQQCRARWAKLLALLAEGAFWAAAFGSHLVFLQYTVTAGMLAGAAIFWMLTSDAGACSGAECRNVPGKGAAKPAERSTACWRPAAAFLRENVPALLLYWLAFNLRSEMALLLFPLAGAAGLCKWGQERKIFAKENVCKYLLTFGVLAAGLIVWLGLDSFAYRDSDWSAFRQFFDARTELYDYQKDFIDHYEENEAYYAAVGVSRQQQALLANYNFGTDDAIDETLMETLKQAAVSRSESGGFFRKSVPEGIWSLVWGHWAAKGDFPYNMVFVLCGGFAFVLCFVKGRRRLFWQAPLCAAAGGCLWMFLLLRDRLADRVLHPLYLGQILVFAGLLLLELRAEKRIDRENQKAAEKTEPEGQLAAANGRKAAGKPAAATALAVLMLIVCIPQAVQTAENVSEEYARREMVNRTNEAVLAYCSAHPGRLFLEDVYSTVSYSEKISVDRDKPFNYDLLGGWLVKSPLTEEKLRAFGYASMGEATAAGNNVSLLTESESDMQWLADYFAWKQIPVRIVKTGTVAEGVDVYQVLPEDTGERLE